MAERDQLRAANAVLIEALEWIKYETGQYADGAEDAGWCLNFLTIVERRAADALASARKMEE